MLKWLLTTVSVGAIPLIMRALVYYLLSDKASYQAITVADIIVLGLIINISIFNERHGIFYSNPKISSTSSTISLAFIMILTALLAIQSANEACMHVGIPAPFSNENILRASQALVGISLLVCFVYMASCYPSQQKANEKGVP